MPDTNLGTAKGKIVIDSSDAKKGLDETGRAIDNLDEKANNTASHGLTALSAGLFAAGAAGVAAFGYAINAAADFEATLSGIKAVSGATEKQMESLRKKALQLGADTAFSASEAAMAMEELSKAGLSVEDILNGAADATVNLAAAGGVSLPEAATIAANAMNQFNLAAEDMPHVADLIAGAANASAISVSDIGMAMAQAGATANLVGLSFDDLALAITAMGNAGIKGSDAGTSIKTFLANLQPVTDAQKDAFADLGLTIDENITSMNASGNAFFDAQGKIKPLTEIAGLLGDAMEGMSEQQKMATLEVMFGSDAIRAAAIIAGEGKEGFEDLSGAMGGITAADVAATRLDNFNGSLEQLKGSIETAVIGIGERFLPVLRDVVDKMTEGVNAFGNLDEGTQDLIIGAAAAATSLALLAGGTGLAVKAAAPAAQGIASLAGSAVSLGGSLVSTLGVWGLVVIAIAAAVAGVIYAYQHFEGFREVVDNVAATVVAFAETVWEYFNNVILPALQSFADFFMEEVLPVLISFYETAVEVIENVVSFFTDTLVPGVIDAFNAMKAPLIAFWNWFNDNVVSTANSYIELLLAIFNRIIQFIDTILLPTFKFLWNLFAPIVKGSFEEIKIIVDFALDAIKKVIEFVSGVIEEIWSRFGDNLLSAITLAFDFIKGVIEVVLGIIRGTIQFITGLINGDWDKAWEGIKTIVSSVWDGIKLLIDTAINAVKLTIQNVLDLIGLAWNTFWGGLSLFVSLLWDGIKAIVKLAIEKVQSTIETVMNALKLTWDTIWGALSGAVQTAYDTIKGIVDKIKGVVQGAIDKIKDLAKSIGGALNPFDGDIVPFLAEGGIITRATMAVIGEAGPEAVIPLNNPARAMSLMIDSGLARMLVQNYAPFDPSNFGVSYVSETSPAASPSAPSQVTGVNIETAYFEDGVDIQTLMAEAEFALGGIG